MAFLPMQIASLDQSSELVEYNITENAVNLPLGPSVSFAVNETQDWLMSRLRQLPLNENSIESFIEARSITSHFGEVLAYTFNKHLEHPSLIPLVVQELKDDAIITEEEWKRLTILRMVLDGLDVEIGENGGELRPQDLDKAVEFCEIIREILLKKQVQTGMAWNLNDFRMYTSNSFNNWYLEYERTSSALSSWSFTGSQALQ